jgi:NitT/TauT family transport system ATP-binding protein
VNRLGCQLIINLLSKAYASPHRHEAAVDVLDRVSLCVHSGELACLLGPSGCGKSTLLSIVAGFDTATSGQVLVNGREVAGPGPDRGVAFQEDALFPWLTVRGNIAYGLKRQHVPGAEQMRRINEFLELVGLTHFADYHPDQISGGMKQRVALARVMVNFPSALLMDETFAALDAQTRAGMQDLLLDVWGRLRQTVLFVTHDVDEAITLADRIFVMTGRPGAILEDIAVDLPRPREFDEGFLRMKRRVLALLDHAIGGERPWLRRKVCTLPSELAGATEAVDREANAGG